MINIHKRANGCEIETYLTVLSLLVCAPLRILQQELVANLHHLVVHHVDEQLVVAAGVAGLDDESSVRGDHNRHVGVDHCRLRTACVRCTGLCVCILTTIIRKMNWR